MSWSAAPVFNAVMIGREAVVYAPQHRLSSTAGVDFSVDRANVGFHGVGAQICQPGDVGVAQRVRDSGPGPVLSDLSSVVRHAATWHHGTVEVDSFPPRGALSAAYREAIEVWRLAHRHQMPPGRYDLLSVIGEQLLAADTPLRQRLHDLLTPISGVPRASCTPCGAGCTTPRRTG